MPNLVVLSPARLASEPKPNPGQSGKGPTQLRVSTSRRVKNSTTQEYEWLSSFFNVTVWGDDRASANKLEKGTTLHIVGRLEVNQWTDKHDQKREDVRIVADTLSLSLPEPPPNGDGPQEDDDIPDF